MRCLYSSRGVHVAYEDNGELYDREGRHIASLGNVLATEEDEEMIFCDRQGNYIGEITAAAPDRLLYNLGSSRACSGYLKHENLDKNSLTECQGNEPLDYLPDGYKDIEHLDT